MFSSFVKELRKRRGITQKGMAELLGVSTVTLNRWEKEHLTLTNNAARLFAKILNKEEATMLDPSDPQEKKILACLNKEDSFSRTVIENLNSSGAKKMVKVFSTILGRVMAVYGQENEMLYHVLCDLLQLSEEELHDCGIYELDDFICTLRKKAAKQWDNIQTLFCIHSLAESQKPISERTVLTARVIFAAEHFPTTYRPESRTFAFTSDNKYFLPEGKETSIFGTSLDLCQDVRLDAHIADLGDEPWGMDGCFVMSDNLSDMERMFCQKHDIAIVYEPNGNYPGWPIIFGKMYSM